jgi:beta-N-acetylhexosaminidase
MSIPRRRRAHPFGHHFAIGLQPQPTLGDHDKRLLEALRPAGVILFRPNFDHDAPYDEWLDTLRRLLHDVRMCADRERILVGIDHEGGRVHRAPPPITNFAYARDYADRAAAVGRAMGVELRSLGVNVDFAPVVDVHSNPANPVIGARAFGTDPDAVAAAGVAFMHALEAEGIVACPKHFPGHGDTAVDSHHGLPVVDRSGAELRERELVPFRAAVEAGARLVMTAHIVFPQIDPETPSTMSRPIIMELLRGELGFDGLVITDDLGMKAVSDTLDDPRTAERLLNAGTDLLDLCAFGTDTARALTVADNIEKGRRAGLIATRLLDASAERIEAFLHGLPQHEVEALPASTFEAHAGVAPLHEPERDGRLAGTWKGS